MRGRIEVAYIYYEGGRIGLGEETSNPLGYARFSYDNNPWWRRTLIVGAHTLVARVWGRTWCEADSAVPPDRLNRSRRDEDLGRVQVEA